MQASVKCLSEGLYPEVALYAPGALRLLSVNPSGCGQPASRLGAEG